MNPRRTFAAVTIAAVAVTGLAACDGSSSPPSAQAQGQKDTETAYRQQSAAVPYPVAQLTDSLERRNVRERLLRTNKPNAIGYVYILSMTGQYVGYYVIKGKVSSTQSQMTTSQLVRPCSAGGDTGSGNCAVTVEAPGDDGSYGENEGGSSGVFFFTVEGAMVTRRLRSDLQAPDRTPCR